MGTIEKEPPCSKTLARGFSREEEIATNNAIKKLLTKWVIGKRSYENREFVFPVICVAKAGWYFRLYF